MILHSPSTIEHYTAAKLWGGRTLLDVVAAHVVDVPQRVAIVDTPDREALIGTPATSVTWSEFGKAVDAIATGLILRGLKKNDVVF
ncbi:MAG: long-chain fatty acid--CoA ligase, partial [Acidovorax sp.]|nr:long-chain fatty acid--CoA ligase [Acidovorax sp.]